MSLPPFSVKSDMRELQNHCDCLECYECVVKYQANNIPSPFLSKC
jgi:hypothetical protein